MKKTGFLFLFLLFGYSYLHAQSNKAAVQLSPEPGWVSQVSYSQKPDIQEQEMSGGYYQLLVNKQYHLEEDAYYGRFAALVINESGLQELSNISIAFDPSYQSLSFHNLTVIRNGKPLNQLNKKDIQLIQRETGAEANIYDGRLTATVNLKDIRKGDIIEYSFSIIGSNPINQNKFTQDFYWQFQVPVETIAYRVLAGSNKKLTIKNTGSTPKIKQSSKNGLQEYSWLASKTPALVFDGGTPGWYDPTPATFVSEFGSWEEVVDLLIPHYLSQNRIAQQDIKNLFEKLFQSYDSREDKVKKLLTFVQNEIRYLGLENGISAYKPHAPQEVLNQKFGDCKDKSLLFCSLLREIGVEAAPALVHTIKRSALTERLPSPAAFDHCVVRVQLSDTTIWFDPTLTNQGGRYNSTVFPLYDKALILETGEKDLTTIPRYETDKRVITEYYDIKFKGEPSTFSIISRFEGYEADNQRAMFKGRNIKEIEEGYMNYYASQYPTIVSKKPLAVRENISHLETEENYVIPNAWEAAEGMEEQLIATFYPLYINDFLQKPDKKLRKMPLALNYPLQIEEKLIVELPEGWPVTAEEQLIENDYFRFSSQVSAQGNLINLLYRFELLKDHVPPADVATYLKDLDKAQAALGYQINYYNKEANGREISTPLLIFALLVLGGATFGAVKLYFLFDPPRQRLETEYFSIGGWLFLPLIGLIITPFSVLKETISWDYFDGNILHNFFLQGSPWYNPSLGSVIVVELAFNLSLLVFAVFLLVLLFSRRTSFPLLMKVYLIYNAGFLLLETLALGSLDLLASSEMGDVYTQLGRAIFSAVIWVPYFTISERVKGTFTVQQNPAASGRQDTPSQQQRTETAALH